MKLPPKCLALLVPCLLLGACFNPYGGYDVVVTMKGDTSACLRDAMERRFGAADERGWHHFDLAVSNPAGDLKTTLASRLESGSAESTVVFGEIWMVGKNKMSHDELEEHERAIASELRLVVFDLASDCGVARSEWDSECDPLPWTKICPNLDWRR